MRSDKELPINRAWCEFTVWLIPRIGKFPRDLRFTLGERVEQKRFVMLDDLNTGTTFLPQWVKSRGKIVIVSDSP